LEEQLAKIDPATLQYLDQLLAQNPSAIQDILENALDETPKPPRRPKRAKKKQKALAAQNFPTKIDVSNIEGKFEGFEAKKGRRFIRWRFIRGLEKTSHQTLWQIFERMFAQRFKSDTFTRISCATLKMIRSLCITLTTTHLGLTIFLQRRNG